MMDAAVLLGNDRLLSVRLPPPKCVEKGDCVPDMIIKRIIVAALALCALSSQVQAACTSQCNNGQLQTAASAFVVRHFREWTICRPAEPEGFAIKTTSPTIIRRNTQPRRDDRRLPRQWRGWPANELK
jgi:hypothetical protein